MQKRTSRKRNARAVVVSLESATKLAQAYRAMSSGLVNIFSEDTSADRKFQHFVAALDPKTELSAEARMIVLGVSRRKHIDLMPASGRLDASGNGDDQEVGYRLLSQMMRATLRDLFIAFVRGGTTASVPTYIFGRLDGRHLVGLRTITIET
jgi:hypothetical protein